MSDGAFRYSVYSIFTGLPQVVVDEKRKQGVAFVTLNNPYSKDDNPFKDSPCQSNDVMHLLTWISNKAKNMNNIGKGACLTGPLGIVYTAFLLVFPRLS